MSNNKVWLGYFEAGDKSSPVARDARLNTGNPNTVYLFNLNRNQIIEYRRDIAEPKLRELSGEEEAQFGKELKKTFEAARKAFTPRVSSTAQVAEQSPPPTKKKPEELMEEALELDDGDDNIDLDDD